MHRDAAPLTGYLVALTAASLFAWLGPLSRWAYAGGMQPLAFVTWRAAVGTLVLVAVVATGWPGARPVRLGIGARPAATLVVASLMALLLNLAIFSAFDRVTVAIALLGFYTYPAMVALVAVILGRERLSRRIGLALTLALAGMGLVVAGGLDPATGVVIDPLGLVFAIGAAGTQTIFVTISRDGYREVPAAQATTMILGGTVVGCAAIAVASGVAGELTRPLRQPDLLPVLLVAGSLGAAIPSLLFLTAIRLIGGTRTGILMLFEPVVGVILAAQLLGEAVRPVQAAGAASILAAAWLIGRGGRPAELADGRAAAGQAGDEAVAARVPGGP